MARELRSAECQQCGRSFVTPRPSATHCSVVCVGLTKRGVPMKKTKFTKQLPDGRMGAPAAAAYLGVAEKTLANKRSAGTGPPFVKLGRVFYFRDDLDAWLRSKRVTTTAEARKGGQHGRAAAAQ